MLALVSIIIWQELLSDYCTTITSLNHRHQVGPAALQCLLFLQWPVCVFSLFVADFLPCIGTAALHVVVLLCGSEQLLWTKQHLLEGKVCQKTLTQHRNIHHPKHTPLCHGCLSFQVQKYFSVGKKKMLSVRKSVFITRAKASSALGPGPELVFHLKSTTAAGIYVCRYEYIF